MYTIGEFATFGRVSARMLRRYDAIGLLTPARVDVHSGYRHYSNDQLQQLLRIAELRQLGVGLDHIAAVLHADDESTAFRAALEQRKREIENRRGQRNCADRLHRATPPATGRNRNHV